VDRAYGLAVARSAQALWALAHPVHVYMRFSRWSKQGIWARMARALKGDAGLEQLFVDSTIVRAHQHAAGAQKKPANRRSEAAEAD
jgi:transposase